MQTCAHAAHRHSSTYPDRSWVGNLHFRLGPIATIWIGCVVQFCGYAGMYVAATRHLPARFVAVVQTFYA